MFIITLCITIPTGNESGLPGERKMMEHQDFAKVFTCTEQPSQPGSPLDFQACGGLCLEKSFDPQHTMRI